MALTVITSNVNGLHNSVKWKQFWQEIPCRDIIYLQETHLTLNQEFAFGLFAPGYNFYFSHGTLGSAGMCTAVR